ncbi:MAG: TIGR03960 family B12-binding radical SAM protein [Ruminococcaceae bacterium]|nr:TIGR03960 family B12-binding radical SAM protein [Oscillospiraceae bacterium]
MTSPSKKAPNSTILKSVSKPGRYAGGEFGQIIKDASSVKARFAFCFPDTYEIGMSNLGMRLLYASLNEHPDIWCERAYDPWTDMQEEMKKHGLPLTALESGDPLSIFDFVGFTLQYEMSYTNVLNMLSLAHIPLRAEARSEEDPLIIGGGPCAYNPEPIAPFFDLFNIGEGEDMLPAIVRLYIQMKDEGRYSRASFLLEAARTIPGVYVPSLYEVTYNEDGTIKAYTPTEEGVPARVTKQIIKDLDAVTFPDKVVMPYIETVHDRIMLEVYRGCIRGCRFCQAGMIYRPVREKTPEVLSEQAKKLYCSTGYEEISLSSLSISDYTALEPLCDKLLSWTDDSMVSLTLPSLRVDSFNKDLMRRIESVRSSSLTFAPEAGTQRLRDVINKNVREEDVLRAVNVAFDAKKNTVKLYFMNGLPTETYEDIEGIATLAERVVEAYYENPNRNRARPVQVTVSVSCFIPKPFTPFQWEAQDTMEMLAEKQEFLKTKIKSKHVRYQHHDAKVSRIEAVLARGDRRLADALELACHEGFYFDAWDEYFDYDKWISVLERTGIDPAFYANRRFGLDEVLPWDIIDCGVSKEFFLREREKAYAEVTTPNCREQCSACGANKLGGVRAVCPGCGTAPNEVSVSSSPVLPSQKKNSWKPLDSFKSIRIKFRKVGDLQYISHLDLQRTVSRVLVRAGLPMWYTQGYNPHAKVIFGLPLSVGTESECEFIDLRVDRDITGEEVKELLNLHLTDEMQVLDAYEPTAKFNEIGWAKYEMKLSLEHADEELAHRLEALYTTSPLMMTKKTKSGEREIDLIPLIRSVKVTCEEENTLHITAVLAAGNTEHLNPELIINAAREKCGILSGNPARESYSILRTHVYLADGETEFR